MLWKLILAAISVIPGSTVSRHDQHLESEELTPYPTTTDYGPQTLEERKQAFKAFYNPNEMILPHDFRLSAGIKDVKYRWGGYPGKGEIPYVIDKSLDNKKYLIKDAMDQYNKNTCIKFVPRRSQKDYIKIQNGTDCKSVVGKLGGEQIIILGDGCYYTGTIVHELGHAIGLEHEHQRSDRDTYLWIYRNNITAGREHNFDKTPASQEIIETPFNQDSIMIYGNYAFSDKQKNLMTMEAKNGKPLREPYDKQGLDPTDIIEVKKLYKCK